MKTSPFAQFLYRMVLVLPLAVPAAGLAQDSAAAATHPLPISFVDSATGAAIQPEAVTSQPQQPGAVGRRLAAGEVGRNGRATLALERGRHTITAVAPGYKPMWGDFVMSDNNPYKIQFVLDPVETPRELQPEYVASLHRDGLMLIQGFVVDDDSGALLRGVRVRAVPSGLAAETDGRGFFQFYVPVLSEAERKLAPAAVVFEKPGYQSLERQQVHLWSRGDCTYRIRLLPGQGAKTVDERQGRRRDPEDDLVSAAPSTAATGAAAMDGLVEPLDSPAPHATAVTNSTVRVPRNIRVRMQDGSTIQYLDMQNYCKYVLPNEWEGSWGGGSGMNCLYAGAVAVRSYATAWMETETAYSSTFDICGDSNCQNYDPTAEYSTTDIAVTNTENWVMVDSSGLIANTRYADECNSTNAGYCGDGFAGPSSTGIQCIYDPVCYLASSSAPKGGNGMCQRGTYRWSIGDRGFTVRDWTWLLRHYYPLFTLVKGSPLAVGDSVKPLWNPTRVYACSDGSITNGTGGTTCPYTTEPSSARGTIIGAALRVGTAGQGWTWYQVQWSNDGKVGWTMENYLERDFSAPATPTNLTAKAVGTNRIDLSWGDASGGAAVSFSLERANNTGGPWQVLATVAASITNYSDLNLYSGSLWYYHMRAYNAAGLSAYSPRTSATTSNSAPVQAFIPSQTVYATQTLYVTNSATAPDFERLITDFGPFLNDTLNGQVMFNKPSYSPSTSGNLGVAVASLPAVPDLAVVTDTYPTSGHGTGRVMLAACRFINPTNPWLLLTTANAPELPNPVISITNKLRFDLYSDNAIQLAMGCRKLATGTNVIGSDGGTVGDVVWVGVTNMAGNAPMPTRTVPAGAWTTLTFDLPHEPIWNPSGGTGVLSTASGRGVLEHLAIVPAAGTGVYHMYLDNFTVLVPRTLTWSLDPRSPTNATINPNTGDLTWTPTAAQGGAFYRMYVIVADNSLPPLRTTNSFLVTVYPAPSPTPPTIQSFTFSGANATLAWSATSGVKYRVQFKNDLNNPNWTDLVPDVTATGATASITDTPGVAQRFYRVQVVP